MDDTNPPTRLRNACDQCHKVKRRCNGAMPCENCATVGASCFYSVVGRLGRPRGSKSRRNADSIHAQTQAKSPPMPKPATPLDQTTNDALSAPFDTCSMLDFNIDSFDAASPYDLFINSNPSPDAMTHPFSASVTDADLLRDIERLPGMEPSNTRHPTGTITPISLSPEHVQHQQQQNRLARQQPDPRLWALFLQQQQQQQQQQVQDQQHNAQQQIQAQPQLHPPPPQAQRSPPPSRATPPLTCQCIPRLSTLLHDLKRTEDPSVTTPPVGPDTMLTRTNDALAHWSAFASCPRCQSPTEDDDGETLLLAALTMRRVVAQLKSAGRAAGLFEECASGDGSLGKNGEGGPTMAFGAYRIEGSDRTMLLRVLRTITFRKLDAAVGGMMGMLRGKEGRGGDEAILAHVRSTLGELAKAVKV